MGITQNFEVMSLLSGIVKYTVFAEEHDPRPLMAMEKLWHCLTVMNPLDASGDQTASYTQLAFTWIC